MSLEQREAGHAKSLKCIENIEDLESEALKNFVRENDIHTVIDMDDTDNKNIRLIKR